MKFYSGLAAKYYDAFFLELDEQEINFYVEHIKDSSGAALEIGCGTGRLMLPLLHRGFSIEGFDSSSEMLAVCKAKAASLKLDPVLYHNDMQTLNLPKKYGLLYSPLGTFQQLADRQVALQAIKRFHEHLIPGGKLLLYLYLPWHNVKEFGAWQQHDPVAVPEGGKSIVVHEKIIHDPIKQQLFTSYRYELFNDDGSLFAAEEKELVTRWYSRYEMCMMLEQVGFGQINVRAGYEDQGPFEVMFFVAKKM